MTRDEIFEIAHHFYRMGFFQTKEGQFKKYFDEYMELLKHDEALLQADVIKSVGNGANILRALDELRAEFTDEELIELQRQLPTVL